MDFRREVAEEFWMALLNMSRDQVQRMDAGCLLVMAEALTEIRSMEGNPRDHGKKREKPN